MSTGYKKPANFKEDDKYYNEKAFKIALDMVKSSQNRIKSEINYN